jgi:hypothetical protein
MVVVTCLCGETLFAPDRCIGLRGRCPHCNRVRHIPKLGVATRSPLAREGWAGLSPIDADILHAQRATAESNLGR